MFYLTGDEFRDYINVFEDDPSHIVLVCDAPLFSNLVRYVLNSRADHV